MSGPRSPAAAASGRLALVARHQRRVRAVLRRRRAAASFSFACSEVSYGPGSTSATWMPKGMSSSRQASIMPSSAHFDAWYGPTIGTATRPDTDPSTTIRPGAAGAHRRQHGARHAVDADHVGLELRAQLVGRRLLERRRTRSSRRC